MSKKDEILQAIKEWDSLSPEQQRERISKRKREEKWCPSCGKTVDLEMRFCIKCGAKNSYYSKVAFEDFFECTLEELIREDCKEHLGVETNYCMLCGNKLRECVAGQENSQTIQ